MSQLDADLRSVGVLILALATLALPNCVTAANVTEAFAVTTLTCDWRETLTGTETPGHYEANPWLGEHPSAGAVSGYFAAWIVGLALVNATTPVRATWFRVALNTAVSVVEIGTLYSNGTWGIPLCR